MEVNNNKHDAFLSVVSEQVVINMMRHIPEDAPERMKEIQKRAVKLYDEDTDVWRMIFTFAWHEGFNLHKMKQDMHIDDGARLEEMVVKSAPSTKEAFEVGRKMGLSDEDIYNILGKS